MTEKKLAQRLDRLERQVANLQQHVMKKNSKGKTWKDYIGMFRNDRDFEEAMAMGAAYRRSTLKPSRRKRS